MRAETPKLGHGSPDGRKDPKIERNDPKIATFLCPKNLNSWETAPKWSNWGGGVPKSPFLNPKMKPK